MYSIRRLETHPPALLSAVENGLVQCHYIPGGRKKLLHSLPSVGIVRCIDLNAYHVGGHNAPVAGIHPLQDQRDRLCFKTNTRLPLIIKGSVQA